MNPNKDKVDFFISYADKDTRWAEWIAWILEEDGYRVIVQAWDFVPGSNFVLQMHNALIQSKCAIALLSPTYVAFSQFAQPEWAAAFAKDPTGKMGTLKPVKVENCVVEGLLKPIVLVDLVGMDETRAREKVRQAFSGDRMKPSTQPDFPGVPSEADVKHPLFPAHEEEGLIDLVERGSKALENGNLATVALTEEMRNLGYSAHMRAQEFREAAMQRKPHQIARFKQIARAVARDLRAFSTTGKDEVQNMSFQYESGFGAWTAALELLPDFGPIDSQLLTENLASIDRILASIPPARKSVKTLRDTLDGLPRIESLLNIARKQAVLVLDGTMRVFDRVENLASTTRRTILELMADTDPEGGAHA